MVAAPVPPMREVAAETAAESARAAGACVVAHGYRIRAFLRPSHTPPSAAGSGSGEAARTHPTNRQRENKSCGVPCANRRRPPASPAPLQHLSPHSLDPPRRDSENAQKTGKNREKYPSNMPKIWQSTRQISPNFSQNASQNLGGGCSAPTTPAAIVEHTWRQVSLLGRCCTHSRTSPATRRTVSRPCVLACGSLDPPRRDSENAQKTGKNKE